MGLLGGIKNIGKAYHSGLSLGLGKATIPTMSGMAIGAGAAAGAAIGFGMEGKPIGETAAIGAAAGALALPAAGLASAGAYHAGSAALNVGASAVEAAPGAALGALKFGASAINGVGMSGMMGAALSPVRRTAHAIGGIATNMVRWDNVTEGLKSSKNSLTGQITGGVKLTGLGSTLLWGSTLAAGGAKAFREYNQIRMGEMDGQVTRATPRTPAYDLNAGATGDLVFALNANRRG